MQRLFIYDYDYYYHVKDKLSDVFAETQENLSELCKNWHYFLVHPVCYEV